MKTWTYEIFLGGGELDHLKWQKFLQTIANHLHLLNSWQVFVNFDHSVIRYYLSTPRPLPFGLALPDFLLKESELPPSISTHQHSNRPYNNLSSSNLIDLSYKLQKQHQTLQGFVIDFRTYKKGFTSKSYLAISADGAEVGLRRLTIASPAKILAVNFSNAKNFSYKKFPKYLKIEKVLKLLQPSADNALFSVDTFPYQESSSFLRHDSYDFAKHSLILGGSGSGKSKFIASFVDKIHRTAPDQYKIVVIDPHDALKDDFGDIDKRKIIDFQSPLSSINLFQTNSDDINVGVELMLTLFRSLMGADYNSELERVLRYASFLLMTAQDFSFLRLRQLLTDVEYRNDIVRRFKDQVPSSVSRFFLTDFNELRTRSYTTAIAPAIVFIDEMQMVPVFNDEVPPSDLASQISNNFLTVFSLSRPRLGNKVTQTIAGLLMQQLFLFAQKSLIPEHLIIIIDEVAIVENPILARFLSELRKYRTSIVLAGQYFNQFSDELRAAIFANTANYYIFRVSKSDAELLTHNLNIKLASSDKPEDQEALLTGLKSRECFIQVSRGDEVYPGCKGRTLDYLSSLVLSPDISSSSTQANATQSNSTSSFTFSITDAVSAREVMHTVSSSRKILNKEEQHARTRDTHHSK